MSLLFVIDKTLINIDIFFLCWVFQLISFHLCWVIVVEGNDITTAESLQFNFATVEAATNKFSADNKLGEGGFGEVYKVWFRIYVTQLPVIKFITELFHEHIFRVHFPTGN